MKINWKLFFILWVLCLLGVLLIIPYQLSLLGGLDNLQIPLYMLVISTLANNSILFAIVIFLGLLISPKVGLGLPLLEGWLKKEKVKDGLKSILPLSVGLGILAGALIIAFDIIFSHIGLSIPATLVTPPAWQGLLSSFYGGINEEVLMRLFFMSLLVYLTFRIKKTDDGQPTRWGVWFSILLAALIFGAGHLPTLLAMGPLTPLMIIRTLILNSLGGIVFGWLYWKKGLEASMISHFTADLVLHVLLPIMALGV
jgi:membrane protease YdiL (CAAX protease family)